MPANFDEKATLLDALDLDATIEELEPISRYRHPYCYEFKQRQGGCKPEQLGVVGNEMKKRLAVARPA